MGVSASVNDSVIYAGNIKLMNKNNIDVSKCQSTISQLSAQGKTPLFLPKITV